jgi:hypothetical protein
MATNPDMDAMISTDMPSNEPKQLWNIRQCRLTKGMSNMNPITVVPRALDAPMTETSMAAFVSDIPRCSASPGKNINVAAFAEGMVNSRKQYNRNEEFFRTATFSLRLNLATNDDFGMVLLALARSCLEL